jgi:hypothetical protein
MGPGCFVPRASPSNFEIAVAWSSGARVVTLAVQNGLKIYPAGVDCPIILKRNLARLSVMSFLHLLLKV